MKYKTNECPCCKDEKPVLPLHHVEVLTINGKKARPGTYMRIGERTQRTIAALIAQAQL